MKRFFTTLLCLLLVLSVPAACGTNDTKQNGGLSIVVTVFPQYDWVKNILGSRAENADITLLLDSGVDLHSFQPSAEDIVKISSCDMLIYTGGESDSWVREALKSTVKKDMVVVNLMDVLGDKVKQEEIKEGMQEEQEHEHENEHEHETEHEHEGDEHEHGASEYDEHVWLSLRNAAEFCSFIAEKLCLIDPENAAEYRKNAEEYIQRLNKLDGEYEAAASSARIRTLLFGDRFPFRYLTDDYALDYYAAFAGCSAETEASFETIVFLANKADELGLRAIMQIESSDGRIAETIRNATTTKDQRILTLDSMQSVTMEKVKNGASYLSIMEKNLSVLKDALN